MPVPLMLFLRIKFEPVKYTLGNFYFRYRCWGYIDLELYFKER